MNRITITNDEIGGFRVTILARRHWPLVLFLSVWLCGWVVGEVAVPVAAVREIFFGRPGKEQNLSGLVMLLVWFPLWTVAGLVMMLVLWWSLAGREVVTLAEGTITVSRALGPFRRARSFDLPGVRNLRFSPLIYNPWSFSFSESWGSQLQMVGLSGGSVAFDHGGKTHRFGSGLTETESLRLIETIRRPFKIIDDRDVEPLPISND